MSNIRWTGIEKYKYNLDANWYVSAQYGNDYDVDSVGLFHPVNNPNGHGGKLRPFATIDKIIQDANIVSNNVVVFDSGQYTSINTTGKPITLVGDGVINFINISLFPIKAYNIVFTNCISYYDNNQYMYIDCKLITCGSSDWTQLIVRNSIIINSYIGRGASFINSLLIKCTGLLNAAYGNNPYNIQYNNILLYCSDLIIHTQAEPFSGQILDYFIFIGTVSSPYNPINGKTTGITPDDYKADGKYFLKSFSEVDLFGNASGSGATTEQIQQIFNGYFFPIMPDDLPFLDMSLKPMASNKIKYGGLNGYYIGALPVGYSFSAADLWNTWRDVVSTTGMKYDDGICLDTNQTSGTYRSIRISLPKPVIVDAVNFFNNLLYNESNVAAQRIDVTPDAMPDNTLNQRTVYDYRLSYSPSAGGALSEFKNFELNKPPYIDSNGNSALSDAYADGDRNLITVQDFIIEFKIVVV